MGLIQFHGLWFLTDGFVCFSWLLLLLFEIGIWMTRTWKNWALKCCRITRTLITTGKLLFVLLIGLLIWSDCGISVFRAMTMGEIGCFLSHYNIWKEVHRLKRIEKNFNQLDSKAFGNWKTLLGKSYLVWWWSFMLFASTQIVERKLERSLVFEDDIRFEPYFQQKLLNFMHDVDSLKLDWDIM